MTTYPVVVVITPWEHSSHVIHRVALIDSVERVPKADRRKLTAYDLNEFRKDELIRRFVLNYRGPEWKENVIGEPTANLGEASEREIPDREIAEWFANEIALGEVPLDLGNRVNVTVDMSNIGLCLWRPHVDLKDAE